MSLLGILFFVICATSLLVVSRRAAPIPLLVGCCYMTIGQGTQILGMSFPVYRLLLATGLLRVLLKGEGLVGGANRVDKLVLTFAIWVMFASFFHLNIPGAGPQYSSGILFNVCVSYFLIRCFCQDGEDAVRLVQVVALLMVPVAGEMVLEKLTGRNLFAVLGGVPEFVGMREGKLRAQGPFMHPILAGTVGAVCVPLIFGIRRSNPSVAYLGIGACVAMVLASASSGPIMSLAAGLFAIALWYQRRNVRRLLWAALGFYLFLEVVMNRPAYYLLSSIDISGGSTGWHRAFLIEQSIHYLSEWWLFGTDITLHWIPNGVIIQGRNVDITNYYIGVGLLGGLTAVGLYLAILWHSFRMVVVATAEDAPGDPETHFMIWCFGAALFAHAATSVSVSYFDQSVFFLWMTIGIASSSEMISRSSQTVAESVEAPAEPVPLGAGVTQ
jgi:hypothetical protein